MKGYLTNFEVSGVNIDPERIPASIWSRIQIINGCWVWTGRLNRNGYGRVWWQGREPVVHRVVWELLIGPIPKGLVLDHLCRNRACCNPGHLEPVTQRENVVRGEAVLFAPILNQTRPNA